MLYPILKSRKKLKKINTKNKLLDYFGLDNSYTEVKEKVKFGFKYLVVIVDIWGNNIDFDPIKNNKPETVLNAFKK